MKPFPDSFSDILILLAAVIIIFFVAAQCRLNTKLDTPRVADSVPIGTRLIEVRE